MKKLFAFGMAALITATGMVSVRNAAADDLFDMSLEDLMNMTVSVASKNEMSIRETPGIVTVLTEQEIKASGAADLMEVLRLVPGFEFAVDVSGLTGLTLRGNMGYIGRVLLMIDGQEVNELLYSCSYADNHYLVDNIEKIEIIRGPGSAIYGGFAELGVINVITKNGADINGISVTGNYGKMENGYSHRDFSFLAGKKLNDNVMFSVTAYKSQANRSEVINYDMYGEDGYYYDMTDNSGIQSLVGNGHANIYGVEARLIYDKYTVAHMDNYDLNMLNLYDMHNTLWLGELKYDWKISDKMTLTPKYNFVHSTPWQSLEEGKDTIDTDYAYYGEFDASVLRNKFSLTVNMDLFEKLNVIAGGDYIHDYAKDELQSLFVDDPEKLTYSNMSGFAQGILTTDIVNVTLGARASYHNEFGVGFAPRIGFTKAFDKLHAKLLLSQAFRSPSIMEIQGGKAVGLNVEPEVARVAEAEIGYRLLEGLALNTNVFYSSVDKTILYKIDDSGNEGYENAGVSGSMGFEAELQLRKNWGFANLNYSYYNAAAINEVDYYGVLDVNYDNLDEAQLVGTSPHKVALNSSFKVFKGLSVSPSLTFIGKKYAYDGYDDVSGESVVSKQDAILLANLFLSYKDLGVKGLTLGAGVHNLLDAEYEFAQAYNGWHSPLPGEGRRISAKLSYDLSMSE